MYAYKETITIEDPQHLVLRQPLPLRKGQRAEILIVADVDEDELERVRHTVANREVFDADVKEAVAWARRRK
jgi:hypothetical protein